MVDYYTHRIHTVYSSSFQYQNSDISFLLYISAIFIAGTNSKPQNWDWTSGSYYGASQDYGWGGNDVPSYSNSVPSYSTGQWSQYQPGEDWNTQQAPTCKKLIYHFFQTPSF